MFYSCSNSILGHKITVRWSLKSLNYSRLLSQKKLLRYGQVLQVPHTCRFQHRRNRKLYHRYWGTWGTSINLLSYICIYIYEMLVSSILHRVFCPTSRWRQLWITRIRYLSTNCFVKINTSLPKCYSKVCFLSKMNLCRLIEFVLLSPYEFIMVCFDVMDCRS